jgi:ClpP class serine protease
VIQRSLPALNRRRLLATIAVRRDATVITMIHRQETISVLGIRLARQIDIDDALSVLRAIRETPSGKTIEIIVHTPGGLVLAASQIAPALSDHDGRIVAVILHHAMGGTLIALAADEILSTGGARASRPSTGPVRRTFSGRGGVDARPAR